MDEQGTPAPTRMSRAASLGLNQQFQRFAHRDVVVDDEHDRRGGRSRDVLEYVPSVVAIVIMSVLLAFSSSGLCCRGSIALATWEAHPENE